jgi:hypothetical protein
MKSFPIQILFVCVASIISAQPSHRVYVTSVSTVDRLALVKNSIELSEWHEKAFWAQYNDYLSKTQETSTHAFLAVQELASVDRSMDTADAQSRGERMFEMAYKDLESTTEYFREISREHTGVVALQFLQTETQLDLMEGLFIYEATSLRMFRLNPALVAAARTTETKYNVLSKALQLTPAEEQVFFPIYTRFQVECSEIVGSDYSIYELFAGEAQDYSPGLAKRLGYDLLTVMKRELELKEKYYNEFRHHAGPVLAARFLAWEDYFSLVCKMTVWAETN